MSDDEAINFIFASVFQRAKVQTFRTRSWHGYRAQQYPALKRFHYDDTTQGREHVSKLSPLTLANVPTLWSKRLNHPGQTPGYRAVPLRNHGCGYKNS